MVHDAGQTLANALKVIGLDCCKMDNKILDPAKFERKKDKIAQPYVCTAESESQETSMLNYPHDDAALVVFGGLSSVKDTTRLLMAILEPALIDDKHINEKILSLFSHG